MSNPFVSFLHFLKRLFGKFATDVEWLLHQVNKYVPQINSVVAELSAVAAANPNDVTNAVADLLRKFKVGEDKVLEFVNAHQNDPGAQVLHDAAAMIVASFFPVGTAAHIINFAIELAYGIFRKQNDPVPATSELAGAQGMKEPEVEED